MISNFLLRKELYLSLFLLLTVLFSCKKDGKLSPDFDNGDVTVLFTDTFSVVSSVVPADSLRTDITNAHLLGIYNDPIFGPVSSSIYTQINLTGVNVNFGTAPTYDSIVLTLDYLNLYGDKVSPITINVYELNTYLADSVDYYSDMYSNFKPALLGSSTFIPNLVDTVPLTYDTKKAHVRIKLDQTTFGSDILGADVATQLNNNEGFRTFMQGLYITTADSVPNTTLAASTGSILAFDMNSTLSTLTVYYNDTSSYNFSISSDAVKYSRFAHNFTGTDIEKQLNNDITKDTTITYASSMGRVQTKLFIPYIKDLIKDGDVTINKAQLILTVENGTNTPVDTVPEKLHLTWIDASGNEFFPLDKLEGEANYGGTVSETETYTYNIARHIHQLLYNTTTDYGLHIRTPNEATSANRVVLGSGKSPIYKIKLEITYSKL